MRAMGSPAVLVGASLMVVGCSESGSRGAADADRGTEVSTVAGTASSQGGCRDEVTNSAGGSIHVDPGTDLEYEGVPPVSGDHWTTWQDISKPVYQEEERPELTELVHSQEHGWTIVWYDDSVASDEAAMAQVAEAADAVEGAGAVKVVFMPWVGADGEVFPNGTRVAMTHWGNTDDGVEHRQFCAQPVATAILAFVERNPYTDSREPAAP